MSFKLRLIPAAAAAVVIAACGGGGAGAPPGLTPVTPAATPTSGVAVDGYLQGASALCDLNANGLADAGEVTVATGNNGRYTFQAGCAAPVVVTGGISADTQLPFKGVLKTPAGATVASPLTTLVAAGMTMAQVNAAVGLPAGTDLLNTDPALRGNGTLVNPELLKKTLAVQQLIQKITEVLAGLAGATDTGAQQQVYTEVAAAFGVLLRGGGTINTGTTVDATVVSSLVKAAAERVAQSGSVTPAIKAAVAAVNAESLGVVTAGSLKSQAEALLKAGDAEVTSVTSAQQGSTAIASFVAANARQLTAAPTAATTTLGSTLTQQVIAGGNTGGNTPTVPPVIPPVITFSGATVGLTAFGSDGGGFAIVEADPVDAQNKVAKFVKKPGDQDWAGATVYANAATSTITPVALTADSKAITVRVYAPSAGQKFLLKLEQGEAGAADVEVQVSGTRANAWETLTFNFPAAGTYRKLSLFPHFGTAAAAESTFYFDDIAYPTASGGGVVTPPPAPTNYLALAGNALSLVNGSQVTAYTMDQFQSAAGIQVAWPLPSPMLLRVAVNEVGTYELPANQKLTAAVAISETTASGKGEMLGYIENVSVSRTAQGLKIAVPTSAAEALVYGVSTDGLKKAVIDFGGSVAGVQNTLSTATGSLNNILLGNVVNYAINQVSNDFTGIYGLRGKYKLTIVLSGLPLRKADGSELPMLTITVPTALNANGTVASSKSITGTGLMGYITLTD